MSLKSWPDSGQFGTVATISAFGGQVQDAVNSTSSHKIMRNARQYLWVYPEVLVLVLLLLHGPQVRAQECFRTAGASCELKISGSVILSPLVADIAHRFEDLHPGITVKVQASDASRGEASVRSGASDIGMLPRGLNDTDRDLFAFPIARDGVAIIVNANNPVNGINTGQLIDILTGRITTWTALRGIDAPISLALRKEGVGTTEFIMAHLRLTRAQLTQHTHVTTGAVAIKFVASAPNGIALASVGDARSSARAGIPIKLLAYNDFAAEPRTIANHVYALSRPLTLITRGLPNDIQKQFIDYAMSRRVIDLQLKYGFVPYEE